MRAFVFLDRDGTLIRDTGYPHRPEDYALLPGVVDGLARLRDAGFGLAIVTNQSGIGRGYFDEVAFTRFHRLLLRDLETAEIPIAATYHCPHLPTAGCECRKPAPGMLWRARAELDADLAASWVIGDGDGDIALAGRAGCRGAVRIVPDRPARDDTCLPSAPDLDTAARILLTRAAEDGTRAGEDGRPA